MSLILIKLAISPVVSLSFKTLAKSTTFNERLTLSKWLKEALNSLSCSWLMPLASRVRIWFSTSLMVLAMVVSSCSQPTRTCCGREENKLSAKRTRGGGGGGESAEV